MSDSTIYIYMIPWYAHLSWLCKPCEEAIWDLSQRVLSQRQGSTSIWLAVESLNAAEADLVKSGSIWLDDHLYSIGKVIYNSPSVIIYNLDDHLYWFYQVYIYIYILLVCHSLQSSSLCTISASLPLVKTLLLAQVRIPHFNVTICLFVPVTN